MKIKLNKSQWQFVGKQAGWMKTASYKSVCKECGKEQVFKDTVQGNDPKNETEEIIDRNWTCAECLAKSGNNLVEFERLVRLNKEKDEQRIKDVKELLEEMDTPLRAGEMVEKLYRKYPDRWDTYYKRRKYYVQKVLNALRPIKEELFIGTSVDMLRRKTTLGKPQRFNTYMLKSKVKPSRPIETNGSLKTAGVDKAIEQQLEANKLRAQLNNGDVATPGLDPDKLEELVGEGCTVYFPVGSDEGADGISWSYGILHKTGENEYALFNTDEGDFPITGLTPQSVSKVEGKSIFVKALYENGAL